MFSCCVKGHIEYNNEKLCRYAKKEYIQCMKTMIILANQKNIQIEENIIKKILSYIDQYYFLYQKINLDDLFWRDWFFDKVNKYIHNYINIKQLLKNKRKQIKKQLQDNIYSSLYNYISDDIIQYVIYLYI